MVAWCGMLSVPPANDPGGREAIMSGNDSTLANLDLARVAAFAAGKDPASRLAAWDAEAAYWSAYAAENRGSGLGCATFAYNSAAAICTRLGDAAKADAYRASGDRCAALMLRTG
jgi:hypothetical protein